MNRSLPPTTHTLEMAQVAELNERLMGRTGATAVTAAALGMGGVALHLRSVAGLADDEVLVRLSWEGSPEFPDIYGHFGPGRGGRHQALLHTAALESLCHALGVRQRWGVGVPITVRHVSPPPGGSPTPDR
jgi:hypothetical protein